MAGPHHTAYMFFHICILIVLIISYGVLVYYIIPEYIEDDKKDIASKYSGYALWIAGSALTVGSMIADYIDKRNEMKQIKKTKTKR